MSPTLESLATGGLAVSLCHAAGVQGAAGQVPEVGVVLYAAACCCGGSCLALAGLGCSKGGGYTGSLLLCGCLLLYVNPLDARPDKGRPAGGWDVHLGDEVEGGEHIGDVIQTSHLGLELVDVIRRLIPTCRYGQVSADLDETPVALMLSCSQRRVSLHNTSAAAYAFTDVCVDSSCICPRIHL